MKWIKRIIVPLIVVFALFYLVTRPEDAANAVQNAVGAVWSAAASFGKFFSSLAA
ncbi:hypothetical protein [Agromyces larvae]|uniref:Uncharacterized protein n=1 Tax=Agromyces larvae TaxID=2929802 RepID=A0ABY4BY35_9MICO|nr:hypothetical protein [Agromyces larvae]UOE43809.1 hypothetical protein MTO99_16810 [Agromyces larvae]